MAYIKGRTRVGLGAMALSESRERGINIPDMFFLGSGYGLCEVLLLWWSCFLSHVALQPIKYAKKVF